MISSEITEPKVANLRTDFVISSEITESSEFKN